MAEEITSPNWIKHNDEWIHVMQVYEDGLSKMYVNGKLNTTTKMKTYKFNTPEHDYNKGAVRFNGLDDSIDL